MMYKKLIILLLTLLCLLTGCSSDNGGGQTAGGGYPSAYPASEGYTVDEILYPIETDENVLSSEIAKIDYSNASQGYVIATLTENPGRKVKVQIMKDDQKINYDLVNSEPVSFPLQMGDGVYTIKILENVEGTQYAIVKSIDIDVQLDDQLLPYLYPNQIVNYKEGDIVTTIAIDAVKNDDNDLARIDTIYEYVMNTLDYDDAKAELAAKQYILPDLTETIESHKGICFDYAALMVAMLRINHIPARLVCGGTDQNVYHAWLEVYLSGEGWINPDVFIDQSNWSLMDPTFNDSKYKYDGQYIATLYY